MNLTLIDLTHISAKNHLLKPECYCTIDLPSYFVFDDILMNISKVLGKNPKIINLKTASDYESVNYTLLHNKDGKYSWRPMQIIHPFLYIHLVNCITAENNWKFIVDRCYQLINNPLLNCYSIPIIPDTDENNKASQIKNWWEQIEQKSIELALKYDYFFTTDITDCYGSIYTHSIPWALHGKDEAKEKKSDKKLLGNKIDAILRSMNNGQTNGIPQGSVLMDFIAEIVLLFLDFNLTNKLSKLKECDNYEILRFRDDYRIFFNNVIVGELILKVLTEEAYKLNFKLNALKTKLSNEIIRNSIKKDKLSWIFRKQTIKSIQKQLLIIHDHANQYPNTGSLLKALIDVYKRIEEEEIDYQIKTIISIVVDILIKNPRTTPVCAAILSLLLRKIAEKDEQLTIIGEIKTKFNKLPNSVLFDVWLQRITYNVYNFKEYPDPLCKLVYKSKESIWNNEWLNIPKNIKMYDVVDFKVLKSMRPIITLDEFEIFDIEYK